MKLKNLSITGVDSKTYPHETIIVALAQIDQLFSLFGSLLDFLLSLLVLHLEHADAVTQKLNVILHSAQLAKRLG